MKEDVEFGRVSRCLGRFDVRKCLRHCIESFEFRDVIETEWPQRVFRV